MASQGKVRVDAEFESLIPAMSAEELEGLERQLEAEGCRDAFVVWGNHGNTLLDGHHRYKLCVKHGLPYPVPHKLDFESRDDARNWMIRNQLSRRNVSDEQRRYLLGKLYGSEKRQAGRPEEEENNSDTVSELTSGKTSENVAEVTAARIAEEHGVTPRTLQRAEQFAEALDAVGEKAPEIKAAVLAGRHATTEQLQTIAEMPKKAAKKVASAVKFGTPIKAAIDAVAPPPSEPEPEAEQELPDAPEAKPDDDTPSKFHEVAKASKGFDDQANALNRIVRWIDKTSKEPVGRHLHPQSILADLNNAKRAITFARFHGECVYCKGGGKYKGEECQACKGQGWIPKGVYKSAPEDLK